MQGGRLDDGPTAREWPHSRRFSLVTVRNPGAISRTGAHPQALANR
ncbi:unnamed protein product, partial [Brugia timori]|uniref:Kinesin motor domain-containing protein n=1 Tax=Brugia timori TaxID=42155 RepID=A0A0R3QE50_9BILA